MPTIEFQGAGIAGDKTTEVPEGGELVDIADHILAPIAFSCRSASCGTCHIEILEGHDLLEAPAEDEQDLLDLIGGPEHGRLGCQAKVKAGDGLIRIRPVLA